MSTKIYTVSELTYMIKSMLTSSFDGIWVEGEIRDFKISYSGHAHFLLTDGESSLRCVVFRYWSRGFSRMNLHDGVKVRSFGRIDIYEKSGTYQQVVELIVPWGQGAISLQHEVLKRKLAEEGIFDESRKRKIPQIVNTIGLVTSPVSAAFRDFIRTLRKVGGFKVVFAPVKVQGEDAPSEIARAIKRLGNVKGIEVIVVTRGGGSREDLSAFNEEIVVRAIANSPVPVISAVGHSIDTTLADLAADVHLFTPTAAAEMLVSGKLAVRDLLNMLRLRMLHAMQNLLSWKSQWLSSTAKVLESLNPRHQLQTSALRLEELNRRLKNAVNNIIRDKKMRLAGLSDELSALNPFSVIERGFVVLLGEDGSVIDSAAKLRNGMHVKAILRDGTATMEVIEIGSEENQEVNTKKEQQL